ncbi:MAG: vWA domain-containing protein [Planctomycetota bacterium]|jgi:hypothetical protein
MNRAGLCVGVLIAASALAADDPHVLRYRQFFREEISGRWQREALSEQRVVMARGFQRHDVPDAARWLMLTAMKDPAGDVVREVVRVLSVYKSPNTVTEMAALWEKKFKRKPEQKALLLHAFGKIKFDAAERPILRGLKDRDARIAAAACRAVGLGPRLKLRGELEKALKHKEPRVRAAALAALGELGGEQSLPLIFSVFCRDLSHRVRYDAWVALRKLTMLDLPCVPTDWLDFWKERSGEVAEGEPNPWGTTFPRPASNVAEPGNLFRIPLLADRICFVLDVSNDMNSPWRVDHKTERKKKREERIPNFFGVKTRWDLVKAYVKQAIKQLPDGIEVAFVFYHMDVLVFPEAPKYLKLTKKNRDKIFKHLDEEVKLGATTAMYEGLKAGWGFLKEGDPATNFKKGCDTLVFTTDGRPTHGKLAKRPDRVRDEVWRVALARNLHVHAIGLHNHQFDLLQAMAKDTGGLYVHAQEHGDTAEPQDLDFWPKKKKAFEAARKKRGK